MSAGQMVKEHEVLNQLGESERGSCSLGAVLMCRDSDIHLRKGVQNLNLVTISTWCMNVLSFKADLEKAIHDIKAWKKYHIGPSSETWQQWHIPTQGWSRPIVLIVCSVFLSCNSQKKQRLVNIGVISEKHSWRCWECHRYEIGI